MARILVLSPLPPARSGIATYARAVLAQLREIGFLDRHRVEAPWPLPADVERLVLDADLAVYHLGNNVLFHREIYGLAVRYPGIVVLHDLALDDLVRHLLAARDPLGAVTRTEAEEAMRRLGNRRDGLDEPLRLPWSAYVARRSRGVVVHSPFARRYLEDAGTLTPVFVAPHPPLEDVDRIRTTDRTVARLRRRSAGGAALVGVLGDVGPAKAIDRVIEAVGRLDGTARLVVVGRPVPDYDVEAVVRASPHRRLVTVVQEADDADFLAWLRACDVVVNLRSPHRGEVSGTLVRALQAGVPTVVSATGTYLDWPDDVVVRVPAGPPDPASLAAALSELLADDGRRRALGERARAYVSSMGREHATGRAYAEAIESTLSLVRNPARRALAGWAKGLTDLGADGRAVRRGLGVRYAEAIEEIAGGVSGA